MMNIYNIYNNFYPEDILSNIGINNDFLESFNNSNLLVIGEVHGIKENADALYSLASQYGADTVAIERPEESYKNFIESVLQGKPRFELAPEHTFEGSVLSLEMIKTLNILYAEKKIKKVEFIGVDDTADVEKNLCNNILSIDRSIKTICVMGNWHTTTEIIETGSTEHISALMLARQTQRITYIEYKYGRGQLYNRGTGLVDVVSEEKFIEYSVECTTEDDFILYIPNATPISHR